MHRKYNQYMRFHKQDRSEVSSEEASRDPECIQIPWKGAKLNESNESKMLFKSCAIYAASQLTYLEITLRVEPERKP